MNQEFTRKKVNSYANICDICHQDNEAVLHNKFWGQRCCVEHYKDGTLRCSTCHRLKQPEIKYVDLGHGRNLCSDCYSITIADPKECEKHIFENVRRFYTGLNLNLDEDIPISLVDKDEMSRVRRRNYEMHRGIIGLATSIWDFKPIVTINRCTKYEDRIEVEKKANKLTMAESFAALFGSNKDNKLLLLFARPDVLMGMTLAHEMMHAWLRLQGLIGDRKPERLVEEGICQVMSHMYGKWFCSRGFKYLSYNKTDEQLQFTKDLNKYYANLKKIDSDEAYREGFKQAMHAVKENGLKKILDCILKKGHLAPKMEEDEDNCEDAKGSLPPHKNDVAPPQGLQWVIV
ncbi:unnamed protein product [Prunus brigantina]